jgi:hypothetical protein
MKGKRERTIPDNFDQQYIFTSGSEVNTNPADIRDTFFKGAPTTLYTLSFVFRQASRPNWT